MKINKDDLTRVKRLIKTLSKISHAYKKWLSEHRKDSMVRSMVQSEKDLIRQYLQHLYLVLKREEYDKYRGKRFKQFKRYEFVPSNLISELNKKHKINGIIPNLAFIKPNKEEFNAEEINAVLRYVGEKETLLQNDLNKDDSKKQCMWDDGIPDYYTWYISQDDDLSNLTFYDYTKFDFSKDLDGNKSAMVDMPFDIHDYNQ